MEDKTLAEQELLAAQKAMIAACKNGDSSAVQALLSERPELAEFDNPEGRFAPLHYAARAGHAKVVKALLAGGANPNPFEHMLRNHCGTTTLELARLRGYHDVVALLEAAIETKHQSAVPGSAIQRALQARDMGTVMELAAESPQLVNATDDDGNTALHRAAEMRPVNLQWLAALLDLGADIEAANFLGFKPIHLTLLRNHAWTRRWREDWRAAGFLLARGARSNIGLAAAAGDIDRVRSLLAADMRRANYQDTCLKRPLSWAAEFGHWDIVRILLEHGADPNAQEAPPFRSFPLLMAAEANNLEMVELLLKHGADAEAWVDAGPSALYTAVERGYNQIAELLALHGASIAPASYAWKCDLPVLSALLKANPSLAQELLEYNDESKPEKSIGVLKLAFNYGADPTKVGAWTLYRASTAPALLKAFLDFGVDPNTADSEGKTTLHAINRDPNLECAALLLDYGADINARDDVHRATPLAWAALFGNKEMVELLLERGAQPTLPDDEPWATPLFWAETRGHNEIAELLRQ